MISRENNFNIVRWMALIMVILGHTYDLMGKQPPIFMGMPIHGIGVRILFVISGYLVSQSLKNDKNIKKYFLKRIGRIFPLLVFVIILTVLICAAFTEFNLKDYFLLSFSYVYHNILLSPQFNLPGVFENNFYPNAVNGSLWTLPIELACYFILPLILYFSELKRFKIFFIIILLAGIFWACKMELGMQSKVLVIWGTDWGSAWKIAVYFISGAAINLLSMEKYLSTQISILLLFIFIILNSMFSAALIILVLPYVIISLALAKKPLFSKFMVKLECSYGMYLWAFVIQQCIIYILFIQNDYNISTGIIFLICLLLTFIFSVISYYMVEKPVNKLINKITKYF